MEDMSSTENNHKAHSCMNTNVIISVTVTKLEMDPEKKKNELKPGAIQWYRLFVNHTGRNFGLDNCVRKLMLRFTLLGFALSVWFM